MFLPYATTAPVTRRPWLVLSLFILCVLAFVLEFVPSVEEWMAQNLVLYADRFSLWQSVTSSFLHGNLEHIIGNMIYLYLFGAAVETKLGWWRFLLLYFGSGLAGDVLFTLLTSPSPVHQGTIGASGCIFGLLAAYSVCFWDSDVKVKWFLWFGFYYFRSGELEVGAPWVVGFYFLVNLGSLLLSDGSSGVNFTAHVGGLAVGLALGYAWRKRAPEGSFEHRSAKEKSALPPVVRMAAALDSTRPREALPIFERLLDSGDTDLIHPLNLLKLGQLYEKQDALGRALAAYKIAANRREDAKFASEAVYRMMLIYGDKQGDVEHALALGRKFLDVFPISQRLDDVLGWMKRHGRE